MKSIKSLLIIIFVLVLNVSAFSQTVPPKKVRSNGTWTEVDHFLNVSKRLGIPYATENTQIGEGSVPLMYNTTDGKLKIFIDDTWIPLG